MGAILCLVPVSTAQILHLDCDLKTMSTFLHFFNRKLQLLLFFSRKYGQKSGCGLYTSVAYTHHRFFRNLSYARFINKANMRHEFDIKIQVRSSMISDQNLHSTQLNYHFITSILSRKVHSLRYRIF